MLRSDRFKYMASREWACKREQVKFRAVKSQVGIGTCERCHLNDGSQAHHLTYERFGQEELSDLQWICEPCHLFLSGKREVDPIKDGRTEALDPEIQLQPRDLIALRFATKDDELLQQAWDGNLLPFDGDREKAFNYLVKKLSSVGCLKEQLIRIVAASTLEAQIEAPLKYENQGTVDWDFNA